MEDVALLYGKVYKWARYQMLCCASGFSSCQQARLLNRCSLGLSTEVIFLPHKHGGGRLHGKAIEHLCKMISAGKMWYLAHLKLPKFFYIVVSCKTTMAFPLMTKLVWSKWLNVSSILFNFWLFGTKIQLWSINMQNNYCNFGNIQPFLTSFLI